MTPAGDLDRNPGATVRAELQSYEDQFGRAVTNSRRNVLDLPSTYGVSAERYRLDINGTRQLLQYSSTAKLDDTGDSQTLKPAAGDTMELRTAENLRYAVGFVSEFSVAVVLNQALQSGDELKLRLGDDSDAYELRFTDSVSEARIRRAGSTESSSSFSLPQPLTTISRFEGTFNWYSVGPIEFLQTRTKEGEQFNERIVAVSNDTGPGPQEINLPLSVAVTAGGSTTGLEVDVGSMGYNYAGDVLETTRSKPSRLTALSHAANTNYEAAFALRIDPNRSETACQLQPPSLTAGNSGELLCIAVDASKTDASSFSAPAQQSGFNSVVQETTSVSTFPDSTGSVVSAASDPGGRAVGFAATDVAPGDKSQTNVRADLVRPFYPDEVVVGLTAPDGGTATDFNVAYATEQAW